MTSGSGLEREPSRVTFCPSVPLFGLSLFICQISRLDYVPGAGGVAMSLVWAIQNVGERPTVQPGSVGLNPSLAT